MLQIYTPDQLNELMAQSDYVVAALPHTDKTEKLVNAAAINSMKKTGVFINIGRGQTVDEEALIKGNTKAVWLESSIPYAPKLPSWAKLSSPPAGVFEK